MINLFILGLIVPSDSDVLLNSSGANTKASPFVYAMVMAGIKVLPSVFNVVICLSVLSVANSATFGSTRTMQALAAEGMAPKFLVTIDKHGRPIWSIIIQLLFGLLAFVNLAKGDGGATFFNWLLALGGLANFFIWGTICLAHVRFRAGWAAQGFQLDQLPFRACFGVWGSYVGIGMNVMCMVATFYVSLYPIGGEPDAESFFESYLAAPFIFALYLGWRFYKHRGEAWYISAQDMDVTSGMRMDIDKLREIAEIENTDQGISSWPKRFIRGLI